LYAAVKAKMIPNVETDIPHLLAAREGFNLLLVSGYIYHSHGGATELSLCDPDREFGICIST